VLMGLDVCHQTHLTKRQLAAAGTHSELGRFVRRACAAWLPAIDSGEDEGPNLYDTLAVAGAIRPGLLAVEDAYVHTETASEAGAGTSVAWLPGRWSAWSRPEGADNALVATAFEALFTERVLALL
jgi:inosine-uridine nucleoside N-ribohydrolase